MKSHRIPRWTLQIEKEILKILKNNFVSKIIYLVCHNEELQITTYIYV
jgi:hypothetical protein